MSAQYASAAELLAALDDDDPQDVERRPTAYMFDLHRAQTHAVLALAEELEALVELLRERLPVPRVPQVGDRLEPGVVYVDVPPVESSAMASALAAAVRRGYGSSTSAAPRDDEPCEHCGGDRLRGDFTGSDYCHAPGPYTSCATCGVPMSEHGPDIVSHEWIRA